jgi:hypothetical protein
MTLKANFRTVQDSSGPSQGPEWKAVSFSQSQEDAMADISAKAPITTRRLSLPRPSFPRLEFGASLREIFSLWNDALKLAYMDPYTSLRRQPQVAPDDDLKGRDPGW